MNLNYFKSIITLLVVLLSFTAMSQNSNELWTKIDATKAKRTEQITRKIAPIKETFFQLNLDGLKNSLQNVGNREIPGNTVISFPNSDGKLNRYKIFEASIMEPELQAQFPEMRSYAGQGVDNPTEIIRFSITPKGLHVMVMGTQNGTQFIDPFSTQGDIYTIYSKRDLKTRNFEFECGVVDTSILSEQIDEVANIAARNANDGILRNYRLALACTGEYAAFHGGTVAGAMAAMTVTMTRVNGVFERDLSITMTMIANNSILIYTDASTDPFNNDDANVLISQSQTTINNSIGNANYDVGHTFSTGGGGLASLGSTCIFGAKARGITGSPQPTGDPFDIDFVAHELGHQFGAPHTFNGTQINCSGSNREPSNAYEPGSGTTIMAYAGICGSDNVQNNSDAYFHQKSLQMIWDHITTSGSCPTNTTATGNSEPTANAGANYTIPRGTPYKLDGSASTDPQGLASLTYTWEQYDLGPAGLPNENNSSGPLVRSFEGTNNPVRYVPRLQDLLTSGGSTTWEKLANVNRNINFRLTVRDNDASGGQTDVDAMIATVTTAAGPFIVTSQSTSGQSWDIGSTQTVTWNVAGTTGNSINEASVNILLSTDGINYDTVLASNVPNDGSHDITVPNVSSTNCRVMVEAANGIFFNINSENISIGATQVCNTYSESNVNATISDGIGSGNNPQNGPPLIRTINVPDNITIESLKLSINVSHTFVGDLLVRLTHPNGTTQVNVWSGNCGDNDNINITFEDGAPAIDCANTGTGNTYNPGDALSTFNGLSAQGDWTLLIADFFQGDTGTLNSWSFEICTTNLSVEENELDNLSIYPNPNNGEFNIGFNPRSGEDINIEVYDIRGRAIYTKTFNSVSRFEEAIKLNNAQSGVYLLSISDGSQKVTKKIVID